MHRDPDDGDALAGIAEATLALGDFASARSYLLRAARRRDDSGSAKSLLVVADTALSLDPTVRGLAPGRRLARGRELLRRTLELEAQCSRAASVTPLADSARALLAVTAPARRAADRAADDLIDLASDLWSNRNAACPVMPADRALALVHRKLRR